MQFSIADTIAARCKAHPEKTAFQSVEHGTEMTYGEVWKRICGLVDVVAQCREGRNGRTVGLLLPNSPDAALAIAACQLAGVIAVPVNGRLTASEMQFIAKDADCGLILTGGELTQSAQAAFDSLAIPITRVEDIGSPTHPPSPSPGHKDIGDRPVVVGYTSGTTGFPKGAIYTNDYYTMNNYRWGWAFGLTYDHVILIAGPMFHISYAGFALAGLSIGCRVRIMENFQPGVALEELKNHCSFSFLVPSMLAMIVEKWEKLGRPSLESARHVLSAGAPASLELLRTAMQMFPNARIAEMYGWTEGTFVAYEIKDPATLQANCVGWPAIGADVAVFGPDGEVLGIGEAGEVGARSGVAFAGYLGNPEATNATMHKGYIMSGDVGRWLPDGRLCIIDRTRDVIISGGENIYTAEIERVLLEHPEVLEAAVVGLADATWGEMVAALLVCEGSSAPGSEAVINFCRESLAGFKLPRRIQFVSELPRNSMGKVQKFKVVEMFKP